MNILQYYSKEIIISYFKSSAYLVECVQLAGIVGRKATLTFSKGMCLDRTIWITICINAFQVDYEETNNLRDNRVHYSSLQMVSY